LYRSGNLICSLPSARYTWASDYGMIIKLPQLIYRVLSKLSKQVGNTALKKVIAMENPGVLNILKYANAVKLKWYSHDGASQVWIRAELKRMDDINGANTVNIADISLGSDVLDLLVEILTSPDTDWMKFDSPGDDEWYVLPSLVET